MQARVLGFVLFQTSRPSQLLLIVAVYLFGAVIAVVHGAALSARALVVGVVPLLLVSASVHYANEYADHETDAVTERTPFSGGSGALETTGASRRVPLYAGVLTLVLGSVVALVLVATELLAPVAAAVLLAATALGWQYSVGPLRLAWRGWGEVTNAALGGLALPIYGAAVLEGALATVALASVPFSLVVLLNLFATQWPDREADAAVGKRTLAVRWSRARLRAAYSAVAVLAGVSLVALHGAVPGVDVLPTAVVVASVPVAPLLGLGAWGYTQRHVPWPTVSAMVGLVGLQGLAWLWLL